MFCPKCKAEYREGFYQCADCHVDLVPELLQESKQEDETEYIDYEEILETYSPADVAFIKSVLDAEGITYFIKGDYSGSVQPMFDRIRLMVKKDQVADAKNLLADMKLSFIGMSPEQDSDETEENG